MNKILSDNRSNFRLPLKKKELEIEYNNNNNNGALMSRCAGKINNNYNKINKK